MKNIAIILAGGVGSRMGGSIPKQFSQIAGKMVIEHTIDAFEHHSMIDEIAVVINPSYIEEMEDIVSRHPWRKVTKILKGGSERYFSTLSAIEAYADQPESNMIFHDAVRPLVSSRIIDRVVVAMESHDAVDVAVPTTDTILEVDEKGERIIHIPNRKMLRRSQTPQAFKYSIIKEAYRRALQDSNFVSTDDCGTVIHYMPEVPIYVVEGEEANMKLTYKEDADMMERLFQLRSSL